MIDRTCTAPECDKPLRTKTFCAMHAYRMKRHGSLERPPGREPVAGLFCTLGDCARPRYNSRGWCVSGTMTAGAMCAVPQELRSL